MTLIDWTELDQPPVRLSLVGTPTGWWSVLDQHGRLFFPPTQDMTVCLRFMQAMASKKDAVIDDLSVERATWAYAQQHSVKVPHEPCPGCGGSTHDGQPVWDDAKGTPWHMSCLDGALSERGSTASGHGQASASIRLTPARGQTPGETPANLPPRSESVSNVIPINRQRGVA